MTIRNKPKHQYTTIQSPDWFNLRRPCVLTIHDHIPCRWNGDGQSRQCLSHPCRLSLSEQPVDTLPPHSHSLVSLFFLLLFQGTVCVYFKPLSSPGSSLLLLYSFSAILCIASPLTLDISLFRLFALLDLTLIHLQIQLLPIPLNPLRLLLRSAYIQMPQRQNTP